MRTATMSNSAVSRAAPSSKAVDLMDGIYAVSHARNEARRWATDLTFRKQIKAYLLHAAMKRFRSWPRLTDGVPVSKTKKRAHWVRDLVFGPADSGRRC